MSTLAILQNLQSAHDGLKTVEHDLAAFPPEMTKLSTSIKTAQKRIEELSRKMDQARTQLKTLEEEHHQAIKSEEHARKELKSTANKAQYTIAMRSLDEKERQLELIQRNIRESEAALKAMEDESENLLSVQKEDQRQFDELHEIFLAEHENQVVAKNRLAEQILESEKQLDEATLNNFSRLMQNKGGRAVVAMENNVCTGCNTKLRMPLVYQLKAKGSIICESCQRILYLPQ